jgi:hypothetical protein
MKKCHVAKKQFVTILFFLKEQLKCFDERSYVNVFNEIKHFLFKNELYYGNEITLLLEKERSGPKFFFTPSS